MKGVRWEETRQKWRAYYKNTTLGYFDSEIRAAQVREDAEKKATLAPLPKKDYYTQSDLARALGVSRGAIAGRISRQTLPPFDDGLTWRYDTIKHLLGGDGHEK